MEWRVSRMPKNINIHSFQKGKKMNLHEDERELKSTGFTLDEDSQAENSSRIDKIGCILSILINIFLLPLRIFLLIFDVELTE